MPTLKKMKSLLTNMIPAEYKQGAVSYFVDVTQTLSKEDFALIIKSNISLWKDCMPEDLKALIRTGSELSFVKPLASFIPDETMLEWVLEARPDLNEAFSTQEGRLWFVRQINEIKAEVGL